MSSFYWRLELMKYSLKNTTSDQIISTTTEFWMNFAFFHSHLWIPQERGGLGGRWEVQIQWGWLRNDVTGCGEAGWGRIHLHRQKQGRGERAGTQPESVRWAPEWQFKCSTCGAELRERRRGRNNRLFCDRLDERCCSTWVELISCEDET